MLNLNSQLRHLRLVCLMAKTQTSLPSSVDLKYGSGILIGSLFTEPVYYRPTVENATAELKLFTVISLPSSVDLKYGSGILIGSLFTEPVYYRPTVENATAELKLFTVISSIWTSWTTESQIVTVYAGFIS